MKSFMDRSAEEKGKSNSDADLVQQHRQPVAVQFIDNRTVTAEQRHLVGAINSSRQQIAQFQAEDEELQMKAISTVAQRTGPEEEELLQGKFSAEPVQKNPETKPNNTGLPDNLKTGIENLSGYSMDDVKVHYNSDKPSQLQAHAYAQGTEIHLASGQERHLPHEAWHVVQQKQGRVKSTMQMKDKVNVNDDARLEKEADAMGGKALQLKSDQSLNDSPLPNQKVIQRLSHEYYDRAVLRWSGRAFAHLSQGEVEQYLFDNQAQIVVGQNQVILIGDGLRTGYAVNGSIRYNCTYDDGAGRHTIFVYHAHSHGRMG